VGLRTRFRNLSWIKKTIAAVLAVAAAIGTLEAAFGTANSVFEWLTHEETQLIRSPWLGWEVWQNGTRNNMFVEGESTDRIVRVSMQREPFELRVPEQQEDVGILIAAWTDDSIFVLQNDISTESIPWMSPGTGIVNTRFGSGKLFLSNEFHNYFKGERVSQNTIPISSVGLRTRKSVTDTPLTEQKQDIFLTVFIDDDKDEVVDFLEYEYMVLDF